MKLIECKKLAFGYNHHVISTIDLTIDEGDFICVIGNNGSGKSTLIKTLLKLTPAVSGKVYYSIDPTNKSIGYLPQDLQISDDFPATVYDIVLSGCIGKMGRRLFYSKKERELANKYLEYLGISQLKNKPYKKLSGGEKQRTLLARALCSADKILVLDEPLKGLDRKTIVQLYEILYQINKEQNVTIIMITHNVNNALDYVNKIVLLDKENTFIGSPEEFVQTPQYKSYKGGHDHA